MEETLWLGLVYAGWSLLCYRLGLWDKGRLERGRPFVGSKKTGEAAVRRSLEKIEGYRGPGKEGRQ
jgi:hypothetical protein